MPVAYHLLTMRTKTFLPYLPYAVAAVVNLAADISGATGTAAVAQYCLMPLLILAVVFTARALRHPGLAFLVAALVFSWGGDVLLHFSFPLGLGSFLLAHLSFIVAYTRPGIRSARPWWQPRWAWVYAAWLIVLVGVLAPHAGALLPALVLYGAALGTMAFLAARTATPLAVGGAVFVASDTLLALTLFLPGFHPPLIDFWVMLTYVVAEALIAIALTALALRESSKAPLALHDVQPQS